MGIQRFQNIIWNYYKEHGRHFPWRNTTNPYRILVSEVMLQQTQARRIVPKYKLFIKTFPTIEKLSREPITYTPLTNYSENPLELRKLELK